MSVPFDHLPTRVFIFFFFPLLLSFSLHHLFALPLPLCPSPFPPLLPRSTTNALFIFSILVFFAFIFSVCYIFISTNRAVFRSHPPTHPHPPRPPPRPFAHEAFLQSQHQLLYLGIPGFFTHPLPPTYGTHLLRSTCNSSFPPPPLSPARSAAGRQPVVACEPPPLLHTDTHPPSPLLTPLLGHAFF